MNIYVITSGYSYGANNIVSVYASKEAAEKRLAKISKEQDDYQNAINDENSDSFYVRKWSTTASDHYAEMQKYRIIK